MLSGFALVVLSLNIYRRKRRAWAAALALSSFSVLFHLTRGLDYSEALTSSVLAVLLWSKRKTFSVRSSIPDLKDTLIRVLVSFATALGYGVAGFWLLDQRHFGINFHVEDSIATTLRLLTLNADPVLAPHTHYARWFLDSLYLVATTAVVYCGFALFRPVVYRFRTLPRERAMAEEIVAKHGRTTLDYFKTWTDKSFFFSPSNAAFIAYRVGASVALALGDPVGPEEEIEPLIREFIAFCRDNGWGVGFHQTLPDFIPRYLHQRLKKLKIGDDAIVDLTTFTLDGKAKKEFRYKVRQLEGLGVGLRCYDPPVPDDVLAQLKEVSDEWLRIPGRRERSFTLGQFDPDYLRSTPIVSAVDKQGRALAFVNLIILPGSEEITIDLMRRRIEAPNGIMDYLFLKLFLLSRERGYKRFNLGMAPMAGFQEREEASADERAIHSFFQQMNFVFSFRGLRAFKAKFATSWEPRYLIYRNVLELPRMGLALRRVSEVREHPPGKEEPEDQ
jgi:phosphatidylglycerol lysyltransferase